MPREKKIPIDSFLDRMLPFIRRNPFDKAKRISFSFFTTEEMYLNAMIKMYDYGMKMCDLFRGLLFLFLQDDKDFEKVLEKVKNSEFNTKAIYRNRDRKLTKRQNKEREIQKKFGFVEKEDIFKVYDFTQKELDLIYEEIEKENNSKV